ncbi:phosphate uptake regulator PhoU [Halanaeroarchaeum sulfurireducens]|uniref:Phosphate regulatory-like protein n=1 Tax=Halanaeroarchaeum sulfurireducens TaxID=1604004 RepID=A0A0F7PAS7_9EURY|nr:phosphate uptake regulator PhoU [Halanaeroarchaeum sulfurireducens]AKH97240.1 phosphate regulatory-like protein [Halanaeroarchaeum sulfurireducens]
MDRRKVQVTGGSTFTVSIPKEWADDRDLAAGDEVGFLADSGSLLLTPTPDGDVDEGTLDIEDLDEEDLRRAVMTMYVSGFDVIRLTSDRISASQRRVIRNAAQGLVGLEILEETTDRVVVRDLLDSSELSIHDAVGRMRLIALSMLDDAITALRRGDVELAADVIERDDDVDRLWYVVSRIFRGALRSPRIAQEIGLPREDSFDYQSSARQLERIADHAAKISHVPLEMEGDVPQEVGASLSELHEAAATVVDTAMDALFTDDPERAMELANEARRKVDAVDDLVRSTDDLLRDLEPRQAQRIGLVVDSLSRSADYGGNVAETALQMAAPAPNP